MVGLGSVGTSQDETQVPPTPNDENIITRAPQKAQCKHCGIKLICETKSHGTKNLLNHIDRCLKLKQKDISQMCISQAAGSFSMKPTVPDKKNGTI